MIDKYEAAAKMRGHGYNCEVVDKVLVFWADKPMKDRAWKNRVRRILASYGYRGSWGWRVKREAA